MVNLRMITVFGNLITLILLSASLLLAQTYESDNSDPSDLEIDGLIVSEAISKIGNEFYEIYYSKWTAPPNAKNFTITISEKPFPRLGNLILIKVNDTKVFERFVQPRYELIVESVDQAIQYTANYLINYEKIQRDLGGDDLSGSGIF